MTSLRSRLCVTVILMSAAAFGLSACNKPAGTEAKSGSKSETPLAAKAGTPFVNPLSRKPGLWEITNDMADSKTPPVTSKICLDATLGERMAKMAGQMMTKVDCTQKSAVKTPTGAVIDQSCVMDGTTMDSHIVVTSVSDNEFHQDIETHFTPAFMGKTGQKMTNVSKWLGACPADMKPGDMLMLMGGREMKMNLYDLAEKTKAHS